MSKLNTVSQLYLAQKKLRDSLMSIPKKNKQKFSLDLIKLIDFAHDDNYNNLEIFNEEEDTSN